MTTPMLIWVAEPGVVVAPAVEFDSREVAVVEIRMQLRMHLTNKLSWIRTGL
jgi:hypothetical protein